MSAETPTSDANLLDVLRVEGPSSVKEMSRAIKVTATAVRFRLTRLIAHHLIDREAVRAGRGRPRHVYRLTESGMRLAGSDYTDLALALWRKIGKLGDAEGREELAVRIAAVLSEQYADQIRGGTSYERMRSLDELLARRPKPLSVEDLAKEAALTADACPYPDAARRDGLVCRLEKRLFRELFDHDIELVDCHLEGGAGCRFQTESQREASAE